MSDLFGHTSKSQLLNNTGTSEQTTYDYPRRNFFIYLELAQKMNKQIFYIKN